MGDELPMIYTATVGLWYSCDTSKGFNLRSNKTLWIGLLTFDILFTWS